MRNPGAILSFVIAGFLWSCIARFYGAGPWLRNAVFVGAIVIFILYHNKMTYGKFFVSLKSPDA